ncbi:MAG: diacylglycerol kinase family lipid kinase [Eubacteriales bacterium]|nr:diacylglycerol kinase family lipid kinase [Eubacteriales bacterium]
MKKKLLFIVNPRSGRGMIKNSLLEIIDIFIKGGYEVITHITQAPREAEDVVREHVSDVDAIVCSGGDGTLDEVVDAVMNLRPDMKIGYIPAGSTNDFANSLGIEKNMVEAARDIMVDEIYQCDVGSFNMHHFVYVAAFGMFTNVSYETDQTLKNTLGHVAYLLEAGKQLLNFQSYHMRIVADGRLIEGNYTYGMITNSRLVGGIKGITGHEVDMNDGLFEVTLVHTPTNPVELNEIIQNLLSGSDVGCPLVDKIKASHLVIESNEELAWTLDGEYGGTYREAEIQNHHKSLHLFLNRAKTEHLAVHPIAENVVMSESQLNDGD